MKSGGTLGIAIVGVAGLTVLILSLAQGIPSPQDEYRPSTTSAGTIYLEACAKCHGFQGEGSALAPPLKGRKISEVQIRNRIVDGTGRMPKFPNVTGVGLSNLLKYVSSM
jgi:mono/diheme cytochrome c family protein